MLCSAEIYKDELKYLLCLNSLNQDYKFYNLRNCNDSLFLNNNSISLVSIDNGQKILGYMSAEINKYAYFVENFHAISFKKNNIIFAKDLYAFIYRLLFYNNYHKINWSVICGSPHEKTYDKICNKYNGKIVGIFKNEILLEDGKLYNEKYYEITKEDVSKTSYLCNKKLKYRKQ